MLQVKMIVNLICFSVFVVATVLSAVAKDVAYSCSLSEYPCSDGACVSAELVCDGRADCADGSDEMTCLSEMANGLSFPGDTVIHRSKRQSSCRKNQHRCRDGTCIPFDGKCDGVVDCPDGSDESHAVCWKTQCQSNWFRCTYGACVDGTAPCNGIQECADNSDELLPRCRNETQEEHGKFKCADGSFIPASNYCDGLKDCDDGSDETIFACAGKVCQGNLFQCAYGACVDGDANCNKIQECADNSDESDELCGTTTTVTIKPTSGNCVLPPYPDHGYYTTNVNGAEPGKSYKYVTVNVTCHREYGVGIGGQRSQSVSCQDGIWLGTIPKCIRQCRLDPHPSVEYICEVSGDITGSRPCKEYEPIGTLVRPECRAPDYYNPSTFTNMKCIDGYWNYVARCKPECGTVTPEGIELVYGGLPAKKGQLPWHAGIFKKIFNPYMQVCGGSLISNDVIITAAHCFWDDVAKQLPTSQFAVAVGKLYRPWNDKNDEAQKSDVKQINIPKRFQGASGNFQDDIAVLIVVEPFVFKPFIRPVCLSFDVTFENRQLQTANNGTVAGWGLTSENGKASPVLQVIELPYVEVGTCINDSPLSFRAFITSDKICAGTLNSNSALCKGDSGGGLAFPSFEQTVRRFYLRGVVSTAPNNDNICNTAAYTSFTQILIHQYFIKQFWTE